jgi:paraquat-inducible protein B
VIHQLQSCHCCGAIQWLDRLAKEPTADDLEPACVRCGTVLRLHDSEADNSPAAAVALAACVLFLPAITLPFLRIEQFGHVAEKSLLAGVHSMFSGGAWFVGTVVLLFSVILPPTKLVALLTLSYVPQLLGRPRRAVFVYRAVEHLGRWGMLDVLLVAVLVAFVKLGDIVQFAPQPGLFVFGGFVLLSLLASVLFNPYYLWSDYSMVESADQPPPDSTASLQPPGRSADDSLGGLPSARWQRHRSRRWLWSLPVLAAVAVALAFYLTWADQGTLIQISFPDGQGLKQGDSLRYNGIIVGQVERVRLKDNLETVTVSVRLAPEADQLAREGSQFWIVRPQVGIQQVTGLETIVGAKYLMVLPAPADAPRQTEFVGLHEAPLIDALERDGLEIVLQAADASGLRRGSPVYYRRLRIGGVKQVALASDGSAIDVVTYIRPQFKDLIRQDTVFWMADGVRFEAGLTGFKVDVGSVESLLTSGIAMAVPAQPGDKVERGHRFALADEPDPEWLTWKPRLGTGTVPDNLPQPLQAMLQWTEDGRLWNSSRSRTAWLLPTDDGLLGPTDMLAAPADAVAGTPQLSTADRTLPLEASLQPRGKQIALLDVQLAGDRLLPMEFRTPQTPEDLLLVGDPTAPPTFVSAARLSSQQEIGLWQLERDLPISAGMHGATAVAVSDGAVIGILLVPRDGRPTVSVYQEDAPVTE